MALQPGESPREWAPPEEFEDYELVRPLGRGETGDVYLALDTVLARHVAVKFVAAFAPDMAARQRFLIEARAAARVQHPNTAVIYRVGEIDDRPYIVSEFLRGQGLDELPKPIPWRRAMEIGEALARGLAAAHRNGVLHCDIKPANAILEEDGTVKLFDFGLATLLDQPRAQAPGAAPDANDTAPPPVVGTPDYMAPEVWRGEGASRRTDVYSLGALLFELCAGKPPFADVDSAQLPRVVQVRDAPLLEEVAPGVDPRMATIINRCLRRDPAERFAGGDELREALERLARTAVSTDVPVGNPYRGLRAFEAEHRALFFGRSAEVGVILDRLRAEPLVLVTGESGVGKSSICRAGVLPLLAEGALGGGRTWTSLTMVPGRHPASTLAASLADLLEMDESSVLRWLRHDQPAVIRALRKHLAESRGLLLFVDQLEELSTVSEPDEGGHFETLLARIAAGIPGLRLLGSLRADFLTRAAALPRFGEEISRALYILRPLTAERIREVIVGPAQVTGVRFETDALVDELVQSSVRAKGALPLLQFALAELWEARDISNEMITAAALEGIGGVAGALARHADDVVEALPPEQQEATRTMAKRLVNLEGARVRRAEEELTHGQPPAAHALAALVRGRLLVVHQSEAGSVYEIAHEVLVDGWSSLRRWLNEDIEGRIVRERLAQATAEWDRLGQARETLWSAPQLAEASKLDQEQLNPRERQFLERSLRAVRAARIRRWALFISLPVVVAAVYAGFQLEVAFDVRKRVGVHLERARGTLEEARKVGIEGAALRRQALGLFDQGKRDHAESSWSLALARDKDAERAYIRSSQALESALAIDQTRQDVRDLFGDVLYDRAILEERAREHDLRDEILQRLSLYDTGGRRRRRWAAPAMLSVQTRPSGAEMEIHRYRRGRDGERHLTRLPRLVRTPLQERLPPGSYLLVFTSPGKAVVRYPILLRRGERRRVSLTLPSAGSVPPGMVYVPPGRFFFGSTASEDSRRGFFDAVPAHEMRTGAYLIGRNEVTYAEWLAFLASLPAAERDHRLPNVPARLGQGGAVRLERTARGRWRLHFSYAGNAYVAGQGEELRYKSRRRRVGQSWSRFPVTGISAGDVEAYLGWLRRTRKVPGARLCTEYEWERAARGADDREFPHGDRLDADDANFDRTYGRRPGSFGPDEVAVHPASRSPFGLDDMAGNAFEWTIAPQGPARYVLRGGSYFHDARTAQVSNRATVVSTLRDATLGFRVCADPPRD